MPARFKKLVRERMARTGEPWTVAARGVRDDAVADYESSQLAKLAAAVGELPVSVLASGEPLRRPRS